MPITARYDGARCRGAFALNGTALPLLADAERDARLAGRIDLQARILGLQGNLRARMGQYEAGVALVRRSLSLALEHNLSTSTACCSCPPNTWRQSRQGVARCPGCASRNLRIRCAPTVGNVRCSPPSTVSA